MKLKRKDIQLTAIGIAALVITAVYLFWPTKATTEGTPINQAQVAEYAYVASANGEVFHQQNCRWAKKICEGDLVGFKSKEDAMNSGRWPCKVCNH